MSGDYLLAGIVVADGRICQQLQWFYACFKQLRALSVLVKLSLFPGSGYNARLFN